jgi:hypothetical protein
MPWQTVCDEIRTTVDEADLGEFSDWLRSLDRCDWVGDPRIPDDCPLYRWLWEGRQLKQHLSVLKVCFRRLHYEVGGDTHAASLPPWAVEFQRQAIRHIYRSGINVITAEEALQILESVEERVETALCAC